MGYASHKYPQYASGVGGTGLLPPRSGNRVSSAQPKEYGRSLPGKLEARLKRHQTRTVGPAHDDILYLFDANWYLTSPRYSFPERISPNLGFYAPMISISGSRLIATPCAINTTAKHGPKAARASRTRSNVGCRIEAAGPDISVH